MRSRWHNPVGISLLRLTLCSEQNPHLSCILFSHFTPAFLYTTPTQAVQPQPSHSDILDPHL